MSPKKKPSPKNNLILGTRSRFVLNQKWNIFQDRRTKRNRTRAAQKARYLSDERD